MIEYGRYSSEASEVMGMVTLRLRTVVAFAAGFAIAVIAVVSFHAWRANAADELNTTFVPITPCRMLDTRKATSVAEGTLNPGETRLLASHWGSGFGDCTSQLPACFIGGCPFNALVLNVTAVGATQPTFLTLWPADKPQPTASSLNPTPGQPPTPNAVTVALGAANKEVLFRPVGFNVFNLAGNVDLIIDITGYYSSNAINQLSQRVTALEGALASKPRQKAWFAETSTINQVLDAETILKIDIPALPLGTVIVNYSVTVREPDVGQWVECNFPQLARSDRFVSVGPEDGYITGTRAWDTAFSGGGPWPVNGLELRCASSNGAAIVNASLNAQFTPA